MWSKSSVRRVTTSAVLALVVITAAPTRAAQQTPFRPTASDFAPGAETLNALQQATVPKRDPVDLARRLLGVTTIPTPPPAKERHVGDVDKFLALNDDQSTPFTITAQLWYKTAHVYMWFQNGYKPNMDAVKRSADTFEAHIYPTVHKFFGSEASPGIDGDVHLYILHARGLGGSIVGYFSTSSEYPRVIEPDSNEHQIFFMNLDVIGNDIGSDYYLSTLAHEFQHMVHANIDENEDGWLNEGMSVLSQLLNGYPELGYQDEFMAAPDTQLNTWSPISDQNGQHYGAAYLFLDYYLERFGVDALKALETNPEHGLESVVSTLKTLNVIDSVTNKPITLPDLFADWTMTNLLNSAKIGDGRYVYKQLEVQLPSPRTTKAAVSTIAQDLSVSQWGTTYLDVTGSGSYQFNLQCSPTVEVVPVDAHSGQRMWWSKRGDNSDMRLTHAFDLTGVQKATLSFWLWYAIEKNFDYGYVEVSTDDGATWKALAAPDSVPAEGQINPYGPAFTAYSGDSADTAAWRHESLDLTPYAGKKILIRFEYLTDDAVNEAGMLLDDISIPEINYSTDAETGNDGWQAKGWARIDNVLPQEYLVQMAEYGSTPRVFRLLGPGEGSTGNWTLEVGGSVSHLTLAISGLAEYTVEQPACQYTLAPSKQ